MLHDFLVDLIGMTSARNDISDGVIHAKHLAEVDCASLKAASYERESFTKGVQTGTLCNQTCGSGARPKLRQFKEDQTSKLKSNQQPLSHRETLNKDSGELQFSKAVLEDECYKAVEPLFKYKDASDRQTLCELIDYCYTNHGSGFKDTNTLLDFYYKLEDGASLNGLVISNEHLRIKKPTDSPINESGATSIKNRPHLEVPQTENGASTNKRSLSTRNGQKDTMPVKNTAVAQKDRQLPTEFLCKVCLDAAVSVTFVPCGHFVSCMNCSLALVECPVCRTLIRGTVKTFF